MGIPRKIWAGATEPSPALVDPEKRRKARLLSSLHILFLLAGGTSFLFYALGGLPNSVSPSFLWAYIPAFFVILVPYFMVRRGGLRSGAFLTSFAVSLICFTALWFHPESPRALFYLSIGVLLGLYFLEQRFSFPWTIFNMVFASAWTYFAAPPELRAEYAGALIFFLLTGSGGLYFAWYGRSVEDEHREEILEEKNRFRAGFEESPRGLAQIGMDGKFQRVNKKFCDILGYAPEALMRKTIKEITFHEDVALDEEDAIRLLGGDITEYSREKRLLHKNGSHVWTNMTLSLIRGKGHEPEYYNYVIEDISERKRNIAEMYKLSRALEQTADLVMITNRKGIIEYVNDSLIQISGYSHEELLGNRPSMLKSGKHGGDFYKRLWDAVVKGETFTDVFINRKKDGGLFYEEKTVTPIEDDNGVITHFVATGKDLSENMRIKDRLYHALRHDALTDLPNRVLFMDRLMEAITRARLHNRRLAVLVLDLDRFKNINDTLGHEIGDMLLRSLRERLVSGMSEESLVARLGGDEFAFLLDDVASENDASLIGQRILDSLRPAVDLGNRELFITRSMGISLFPGDGEDAATLLKNADIAMYRAKERGKNTYLFYSADMSEKALKHLTMENRLRRALQRREYMLYFQPQFSIVSGEIVGLEALLRWRSPNSGIISPGDFISILEETNLIRPVGKWALEWACRQAKIWHKAGYDFLRVSVNVSSMQLRDSNFANVVQTILEETELPAKFLELEITESFIMEDMDRAANMLGQLKSMGLRLAIDDFGTGYSSFNYLRRFPVDTLKIDRSFINDVTESGQSAAIVEAIVVLGSALGACAIAEGVENSSQLEFLRSIKCEMAQGFLLGSPQGARETEAVLEEYFRKGHGVLES